MDINIDLLLEEQRAMHVWLDQLTTRLPLNDPALTPIAMCLGATLSAIEEDRRRLRLRLSPSQAVLVEKELSDARLGLVEPGTHLHRALFYVRGMIRHELTKDGHYIPQHDPSVRIETGLTFKPKGE